MIKIVEINAETNEIVEREANPEEIKDFEQNTKIYNDRIAAAQQVQNAKQEVLDRLGITDDEAKLLLS